MSSVLPPENVATLYDTAEAAMLLRIIDGSLGPGLVSLETLRQLSVAAEALLSDRVSVLEGVYHSNDAVLTAETQARVTAIAALSKAINDEIAARGAAITAEAKTRGDADTAEALARTNAVAAEATARATADTAEATTRASAITALAARVKVLEDKPSLRIERFNATTNASGIAAIVFSPAFANLPDVDVIQGWIGDQEVGGGVVAGSLTKTSCNVLVKISRPTLLLSAGPFQTAAAGVSVTVRAIGT